MTHSLALAWHYPRMGENAKMCPDCRQIMWIVDLPLLGTLWQCTNCHQTVDGGKHVYRWSRPKMQVGRGEVKEHKFKSRERCPRCGESLWVVEVPNYGSRQQCESCRISIVDGAILEWRGAPKS